MSATEKPRTKLLPSWVYERSEPVWPGDWREPDPGQERLDDLERDRDVHDERIQDFH